MKRLLAFILITFLTLISFADARITINNGASLNVDGNTINLPASAGTLALTSQITGGAGWTLLSHQTASASSSINFTSGISNTYQVYKLLLVQYVPNAANTNILLRFSTNGGSSYDSGNNYYSLGVTQGNALDSNNGGVTTTDSIKIDANSINGIGNGLYGYSGECTLYRPQVNLRARVVCTGMSFDPSSNFLRLQEVVGFYGVNTSFDAFQILADTSTITSGEFYLYGLQAS